MSETWTVEKILQTSGGYWQIFTLQTAVQMDLFTLLDEEKLGTQALAKRIKSNSRATEMLLNALVAMNLLQKEGNLYQNTEESKTLLSQNSPRYLGYIIKHHSGLIASWSQLKKVVETGKPATRLPKDEKDLENFLMGMFNMAMAIAPGLAEKLDFSKHKHFLDLGGGPGTYAIQFCLKNPNLKATVYDLPASQVFAEKTMARFGLSSRIQFQKGDYLTDSIKGTYDIAWLSHILHAEDPQGCKTILKKACGALEKGGMLFVHEFILDDEKKGPLFPALFSLNMLVNTEGGQSYSDSEIRQMMEEAGIDGIQRLEFISPSQSGILYGRKK